MDAAEKNPQAKITAVQAMEIFNSTKRGKDLAKEFQLSPVAISQIRTKARWGHIHNAGRPQC